ncbi:protein of unknown function [Hyphomicrobium sp. MC1]|nr:protein of unknown function [Hyphomicrobium sp. MC1]
MGQVSQANYEFIEITEDGSGFLNNLRGFESASGKEPDRRRERAWRYVIAIRRGLEPVTTFTRFVNYPRGDDPRRQVWGAARRYR